MKKLLIIGLIGFFGISSYANISIVNGKIFICNGRNSNILYHRNGQMLSANTCDDILLALSCNGKDILNDPYGENECSKKDIDKLLKKYKRDSDKKNIMTRIKDRLFS